MFKLFFCLYKRRNVKLGKPRQPICQKGIYENYRPNLKTNSELKTEFVKG